MMRMLVTGKTGQVVSALVERGALKGIEILLLGRPEFDLANAEAGLAGIAAVRPDIIVSAAAYTAVDRAEGEETLAHAVNAIGPGMLARQAADLKIPIVHLSTDYVFDGGGRHAHIETDPTNPLNAYGRTKLAGERAVALVNPDHVILRTAWLYSPFGHNFLKTMLRVGAERSEVRVVDDQIGNPTSALDIADAIITIAKNLLLHPQDAELRGVFHMVGSGDTSWAGFAAEIFAISKELGGPRAAVQPISTIEYPTPALRPANSRLSTQKLQRIHGVSLPDWQSSTRATIARLLAAGRTNKFDSLVEERS